MARRGSTRPWLLLAIMYAGFGSSFLAIELTVRDLPPFTAAATRFLVAGLVLALAIGMRRGWQAVLPARTQLPWLLLAGALLFLIGNGGVMLGQDHGTPSWLTALIVASIPVCVAILRLIWGPPLSRLTILGTTIGLLGTSIILLGSAREGPGRLISALPVLVGAISWSVGTYLAARRGAGRDPMLSSAQQLTAGGGLLLIAAFAFERSTWVSLAPTWSALASLAWLVIVSSIVSMVAFYRVVELTSVSTASTYAFVNPVLATLLSGLIVGAWPDAISAWAMPIVVAGVAMVVLGDRARSPMKGVTDDAAS